MNLICTNNDGDLPEDLVPAAKVPLRRPATSKKARLEALLKRRKGATMAQLERSLGWQPHTVRAAISRLRTGGAKVTLDQSGKTPTHRIADAP